jgi:uncharacterized protein (DUF4415 family)
MKKRKPENSIKEDWDSVESQPLSDSFLSSMKPVRESHPNIPSRVRGPQKLPRKKPVSLRLDANIIDAFRATGKGWQSRVNTALHEWLRDHKQA